MLDENSGQKGSATEKASTKVKRLNVKVKTKTAGTPGNTKHFKQSKKMNIMDESSEAKLLSMMNDYRKRVDKEQVNREKRSNESQYADYI